MQGENPNSGVYPQIFAQHTDIGNLRQDIKERFEPLARAAPAPAPTAKEVFVHVVNALERMVDLGETPSENGRRESRGAAELPELDEEDITIQKDLRKLLRSGEGEGPVVANGDKDDDYAFVASAVASEEEKNRVLTRIAAIARVWFENLWAAAGGNGYEAVAVIFALPGTVGGDILTEHDLWRMLNSVKRIVDEILELPPWQYVFVPALKEMVLLVHDVLRGLFAAVRANMDGLRHSSSRDVIVKSLVNCFFTVDFAGTLVGILRHTEMSGDDNSEGDVGRSEGDIGTSGMRLSYETLMQLYALIGCLAATPTSLLMVDKVSHSLDITNIGVVSANRYSNELMQMDFHDKQVAGRFYRRVVPVLASQLCYFYRLHDDLLAHSVNHSSFFSWITGHKLSTSLYVGIDTAEMASKLIGSPENDPLAGEISRYEYTLRMNALGVILADDERSIRAPAFLNVTLILFLLLENESFLLLLQNDHDNGNDHGNDHDNGNGHGEFHENHENQNHENHQNHGDHGQNQDFDRAQDFGHAPLLSLWLCVLSYILHYQYKSAFNRYAGKLVMMILLKLTASNNRKMVDHLRKLKINEFKWKLCHHRRPVVPNDLGNLGYKTALLYMMDVAQVELRFNLTKKLDLDNCKLALTVVYQILLECERSPVENIGAYRWNELYKTLIQFLRFVRRNFNGEDVKFVVEEVFIIFELVLSEKFDSIYELSSDSWLTGSHVAKSMNYDLLFTILHHLPFVVETLDVFLPRKDKFPRVVLCVEQLQREFDLDENRERDLYEVELKLGRISINADTGTATGTATGEATTAGAFNYVSTLRYLDGTSGWGQWDRPRDVMDMFSLLLDYVWVSRRRK